MTINQMEMILAVAQTGSVNKAAQKLFVSQPALSKAIRAAERELGQPIFRRSRMGMELTDYGRVFYRMAENTCRNYSYVRGLSIQELEWNYPCLRVTTVPIRFAGAAFSSLTQRYCLSASDLRFTSSSASDCVSGILEGSSDLAVLSLCLPFREQVLQELEREDIAYEPLQRFEPVITVSRDGALGGRRSDVLKLSDLSGLSLFSIYEKLPVFERMNFMIVELLGLSGEQATICYDSRAGLTDYIRHNEFRCNLDTESVYLAMGTKNRLLDFARTFRLAPPPFLFEVGVIRKRSAQHNPLGDEYIDILRNMIAKAKK